MPVTFTAEHVVEQSRLSVFLRILFVIPHAIVVSLWGLAAYFTLIVAWFAMLFTGRYPEGLYGFHRSFLRYATYVSGYYYLLSSKFPQFNGDDPSYPVQLEIGPPQAEYSRMKVLFRIILAIPVAIIAYGMSLVASVGSLLAWFVELFTGKLPEGLYSMIVLGLSYQQRAMAYYFLITEDWPALTQDATPQVGSSSTATLAPTPTPAAPASPEAVQSDAFGEPRSQ